jgi:putative ABC transport system permease protein
MTTLLRKTWFDLWQDKARTLQVVLVIALGAIGIGLVIGGRNLIADSVLAGWQSAEPPHIKLSVNPPLTGEQIERLERIDGVWQAEGLYTSGVEWRIAGTEEWQTGVMNGRDDYREQKMALDGLLSGEWPTRNTAGVGKISVGAPQVFEGDVIEVRFGDTVRQLTITGVLDPVGPTPVFGENFYVDGATFERITGRDTYDLIQTRDNGWDAARADQTDLRIRDYFEEINVDSVGVLFPFQQRVIPPDVPPAETILNALFLLLGVLGAVVVVLGVFLVYNSISAIVSQQISQIGVMKAIGADSRQVVLSYLLLVLAYGILAAAVSIPIGAAAAAGLQRFFGNFLNLEIYTVSVDTTAVLAQVLICLIAPLFAALIPLRLGMRVTVREAIGAFGLAAAAGTVDRLVARISNVPYSILLTIGNTFRNQRRAAIIVAALVVSGAIFMMVMGLNDATAYTFGDKLAEVHNYQVSLATEEPERAAVLESTALSVEGVTAAEGWLVLGASARPASRPDREVTDPRITVFGQPPDTDFYRPLLAEGRWLRAEDAAVAVVSRNVAEEKGWVVGDTITLENIEGRTLNVEIVGTLFDPATNTSIHVPLGMVQDAWRYAGRANAVAVRTANADPDAQAATATAVEAALEDRGVDVAPRGVYGQTTVAGLSADLGDGFAIILNLLAVMAVVIALVGGVGLSGVLSLSVLERRREIGVMRAIGASNWQVTRLFVGEGVLLGLISWAIALPLSIPLAYFFSTFALSFALDQQLVYRFTPVGAAVWLVIVIVLAVIASSLPARGAARVSVRESLAYS